MRRREFLAILGTATWPIAAGAQQPGMSVIGFLNTRAPGQDAHLLAAFHLGLKEAGYIEGQNLAIEYRFAEGLNDQLPGMAADLVRRQVAVIAANGPAVVAAKAATTVIPIVFSVGLDPVASGLVDSLNRPGGNLTGDTILFDEVGPKRLELMRELVPTAAIVAVLINPAYPTAETQWRDLQAAARTLGLELRVLYASTERDFETSFATLAQLRASALVIGNDLFFNSRSEQLAALVARHAVPTIYQTREFATAGGLVSYGGSIKDSYRQVGIYTGRILKGEKPADLPVQQTTKVELIVNLKTAKELGIDCSAFPAWPRRRGDRMKRRDFIVVSAGAVALPLAARGQQRIPSVGVLRFSGLPAENAVGALREGLRELGYVEGQNINLEIRILQQPDRLPGLAAELVRLRVDVIVTHGPMVTAAVKQATNTIPIVMGRMDDADAHGFVASLARPGGNITGVSFQSGELATKWFELLKDVLPRDSRIAFIWDANGTANQVRLTEQAARFVGVDFSKFDVRTPADFSSAVSTARDRGAKGVVIFLPPH